MANLSKTTRDHDEIRRWAEERGGKPSHVKGTGGGDDPGILRIDFPGFSGEGSLDEISWDDFFEKFDEQNLSLIYQEHTAAGERSNFNKFVGAATAGKSAAKKKSSSKKSPTKAPVKKAAKKAAPAKKTEVKKASGKKTAAKKTVKKSAPASKKTAKKATKKAASKSPAKKKGSSGGR